MVDGSADANGHGVLVERDRSAALPTAKLFARSITVSTAALAWVTASAHHYREGDRIIDVLVTWTSLR